MTWQELEEEWRSDRPCIICRTSGSTGAPKEIALPKEQIAASARRTIEFFGLGPESHLHSCLAPDYIGGKMMLIRAILCGGEFSYETPSNRPLAHYNGPGIDLVCVVPSQLGYILEHSSQMPPINNILVGGSPIDDNLRRRTAASRFTVWETYGMTETASHIAIRCLSDTEKQFRPLPGISLSTPKGRLIISIEGWRDFETNDIAEITPDGKFSILGRSDNVIITGGLKVHPEQVEAKLNRLLSFPVMITSEADAKWGRRVVLLAENPTLSEEVIMDICRNNLQRHEVPKKILFGKIPRTDNGKIKRKLP